MKTTYTFQRGEPIVIGDRIESIDGIPNGVLPAGITMRARMKLAPANGMAKMPGDNIAAKTPAFTSVFAPAITFPDGTTHDVFMHSLSAAQSLELAAGQYLFDSSFLLNGLVISTSDYDIVVIENSASGAP